MIKDALILSWLITLIVGLWAFAVTLSLALNPPTPSGFYRDQQAQSYAQKQKHPADALSRGGADSPVFVGVLNGASGQFSAQAREEEGDANAAEWWMVGLTAVILLIAGFQLHYFREQLGNMAATLKATEDSVRAMQTSDERQLRPYIGLRMEDYTFFDRNNFQIEFICTNYGKSPAVKLGYRYSREGPTLLLDDRDGDSGPDGLTGKFRGNEAITVFPDSKENIRKIRFSLSPHLTEREIKMLTSSSDMSLLIGIEVEYFDVFENQNRYTSREYFALNQGMAPYLMPGGSHIT